MKTQVYRFASQVFEEVLSREKRIAIVSGKLGDKSLEEVH